MVDPYQKVRGWALGKALEEGKEEEKRRKERGDENEEPARTIGKTWVEKRRLGGPGDISWGFRPVLDVSSTVEELEAEIEWVQATLVDVLNEHCKVVTICARSKRWWYDDIRNKRRTLGRATRRWKNGSGGIAEVQAARKALKRAIKKARRGCREDF